jgi:hypothetical protein
MNYKIGELVRWMEDYADGNIVKDAGIGILLGTKTYTYGDAAYRTYTVHRNKHNDIMHFSERDINKLTIKQKRRNK